MSFRHAHGKIHTPAAKSAVKHAGPAAAALLLCCALFLSACSLPGFSGKDPASYGTASEQLLEGESLEAAKEDLREEYNDLPTLSVPTQYTCIDGTWFLVDCYHDRILYADDPSEDLTEWKILTKDASRPHTIAGDGTVFLADDTENDRVLVFERAGGGFLLTQEFQNIGDRPHYTIYREEDRTFYVWSSMSGEMFLFRRAEKSTRMYLVKTVQIPELSGTYIRSFTIDKDSVLFVSGISSDGTPPSVIRCRLKDFAVTDRYPVPDEIAGMVQIMPVKDRLYVTVSTDLSGSQDYATILMADSLEELSEGKYTDVYKTWFEGGGTPYCMTRVGEKYYLTEHRLPAHSVWEFETDDTGTIISSRTLY